MWGAFFPKPSDNILKYLVLSAIKPYSVDCHGGVKKPENSHASS